MKSWKTTLGGALAALGTTVAILDPDWARWGGLVAAFGTFFGLLFARDNNVTSEQAGAKPIPGKLPLTIFFVGMLVGLSGCSSLGTDQTETAPDGTQRHTRTRVWTFWDSHNDLAKLRTALTDKTQSVVVSGLAQESSGSNAVALVESAVGAAVRAGVQAAKP